MKDRVSNPLTVSDLMSFKSAVAEFEFISACRSSSDTDDLTLLDESVNLSVAMHLLGYPSVVHKLLPVFDNKSWEVSKGF
jgi:hypothetical protein